MKNINRKYPSFSLCGLNCNLCPNYHCNGISKCPGCGGKDFYLKHPSCSIINCNEKHDNADFCFECVLYPCERYKTKSKIDSFITYDRVLIDFEKCKKIGIENYIELLSKKEKILKYLLSNHNTGRLKSFFCLGVNLFELNDLEEIMKQLKRNSKINVIDLFEKKAIEKNIVLKLRK